MKNEEMEAFLKQFKNGLQKKIIHTVVGTYIACMIVYHAVTIAMVSSLIEKKYQAQFVYLAQTSKRFQLQNKIVYDRIFWFLDSSKMSAIMVSPQTGFSICNNNTYICQISTATSYQLFDSIEPLIKSNMHILDFPQTFTNSQLESIFVSIQNQTAFLKINTGHNKSKFQLENKIRDNILNQSILANNLKQYNFFMLNVQSHRIVTICLDVRMQFTFKICVVISSHVSNFTPQGNLYLQRYVQNTFIQTTSQIQNFGLIFSNQVIKDRYFQYSLSQTLDCLKFFPSNLGKYASPQKGFSYKCTKLMNQNSPLIGPYYSFRYKMYYIDLTTAFQKPKNLYKYSEVTIQLFLSSNSNFYQQIQEIIVKYILMIRYTGKIASLSLGIIIIILAFTVDIVEVLFIPNLNFIVKVCQLLKNKDQKQFYKTIQSYQPTILAFMIDFFKQYMWIYNISKSKGRTKYKRHLLVGLQIFQSSDMLQGNDYDSILQFIYHEIIVCDELLIRKMHKVKQLPHKKNKEELQRAIVNIRKAPLTNQQKTKKYNQNLNLIDPDDQKLIKNITTAFRQNRGVRFSNNIMTVQIDSGPILRKARLLAQPPLVSCATIKNDLSQFQNQSKASQSLKSIRQEQSKSSINSWVDFQRYNRGRMNSIKGQNMQSIYSQLDTMKLDQLCQNQSDEDEEQQQEDNIFDMTSDQINLEINKIHKRMIGFYQKLIALKKKQIQRKGQDQDVRKISQIYYLTLQKYEKILEWAQNDKYIENSTKDSLIQFKDISDLQNSYSNFLNHESIQNGQIVKACIQNALGFPFLLKNVQFLTRSKISDVKIRARMLIASASQAMKPHLDVVLIQNLCANLLQNTTRNSTKLQCLNLLVSSLERYPALVKEIEEIRMAHQFYNQKNKKFYFIMCLNNLKLFLPFLTKFYQLIDTFDLINVFVIDLEQFYPQKIDGINQEGNIQNKQKRVVIDRIKHLLNFQSFIDLFHSDSSKQKEQQKMKTIKNIARTEYYERQLCDLLAWIEAEDVPFSKYVTVLLQESLFGSDTQSSSSGNSKQQKKKHHQQLTKIVQKGYLHIILAGDHLQTPNSRLSRVKKILNLSPELLLLQFTDKDEIEIMKDLQNYLK